MKLDWSYPSVRVNTDSSDHNTLYTSTRIVVHVKFIRDFTEIVVKRLARASHVESRWHTRKKMTPDTRLVPKSQLLKSKDLPFTLLGVHGWGQIFVFCRILTISKKLCISNDWVRRWVLTIHEIENIFRCRLVGNINLTGEKLHRRFQVRLVFEPKETTHMKYRWFSRYASLIITCRYRKKPKKYGF